MITINGRSVKIPTKFSVGLEDLDASAERNAKGVLIRDRVRQGVTKLSLEWKMLTDAEISNILTAVTPSAFSVTFPSPVTGGLQTKTMYVGARSAPLWNYTRKRWETLTLNLIEV